MAQYHGKGLKVLYNGLDLSGDFNQFDIAESIDSAEVATFGDTAHEFLAGLRNGTMTWNFVYSDATPNVEVAVVQADLASASPKKVMILHGNTVLARAFCASKALITAYSKGSSLSDAVKGSGTFQSSGQGFGSGVLLHALASETTTPGTGTTDDASVATITYTGLSTGTTAVLVTAANHGLKVGDSFTIVTSNSTPTLALSTFTVVTVPTVNTFTFNCGTTVTVAGTSGTFVKISNNGGVFQVQCTEVTGTNPVVTLLLKDSADGITFATIATVTISAIGAQEVVISGNIREYTRCTWTIAGTATPGATFAAVLVRNPNN